MSDVGGTLVPRARTYVVAASQTALDLERLRGIPERGPDGDAPVGLMPEGALEDWLRGANPVVLTDDYAPADNLMAPIFVERGF
jgi:hypothetical protein